MGQRLTKAIALILAISLFSIPVFGASKHGVSLDGKQAVLQNDVIYENGYNLVPLREILDLLGAEVQWQPTSGTLRAVKDDFDVTVTIGSTQAFVNGSPMTLDVAPVLKGGVAYVPIAFLARGLGFIVEWDWETKVVVLKTPGVELEKIEIGYQSDYGETLSYNDAVAVAISKNSDLRKLSMDMENTKNTRKDLAQQHEMTLTEYQLLPTLEYGADYLKLLNTMAALQTSLDNRPYYTQTYEGIVELSVRSSFFMIDQAQNQIGVTEAQIELAKRNVNIQKLMYDLGMVSKVDLEKAELSLKQAEQTLVLNKRSLESEYTSLNALLYYDTGKRYNVVYPMNMEPLAADFNLSWYITKSKDSAPNIKLLESAVDIAEADQKLTKYSDTSNTAEDKAITAVNKASLDVQDAKNALEKNIISAYNSLRDIETNIRTLEIELEKAQISANVAKVQYEAGFITELQLLQALYSVDELDHNLSLMEAQYDLTLFQFNRPYLLSSMQQQ